MYANRTQMVRNLRAQYPDYEYDESKQEKLLQQVKNGGDKVEFICRNLGLVCLAVDKYFFGSDVEDAVTEGILTLLHAAELYQPNRNAKFYTYAMRALQFSMQRKQNEDDPGIYVPASMRAPLGLYRSDIRTYDAMTDEEAAEALNVSKSAMPFLRDLAHSRLKYLDQKVTNEDGDDVGTLGDITEDPEAEENLTQFIAKEDLKRLMEQAKLSKREENIIKKRYGIGTDHNFTLKELAEEEGVTSEYIRQVEHRAVLKLRRAGRKLGYGSQRSAWAEDPFYQYM